MHRTTAGRIARGSAAPHLAAPSPRHLAPVLALLAIALATPTQAQLTISGQVDVLAKHGYDQPLSRNFHGDDPLNELRVKLFLQHWVNDRVGIFAELLLDLEADARVNGAYLVVNELLGRDWLNTRVGLAPSLVGNFGMRSTYFNMNPLIGVPLVWHYRTVLDGGARSSAGELLARKDGNARGLPLLYEACWNIQWELFGWKGPVDYSVGLTTGAVTNPSARGVQGVQLLARAAVQPVFGLHVGVSGAYGPYIAEAVPSTFAAPLTTHPEDYAHQLVGYDLEYARGRFQGFAEGYWSRWETPELAQALEASTAYVEGRFDVWPAWYVAARLDGMWFSEVTATSAGGTRRETWDDDLWRGEAALGYRFSRELLARVGWQHYDYRAGAVVDVDVLALQLSAVF